jgi:hypothetical protein
MFIHSWKCLLQIIIRRQVRLFYVVICCCLHNRCIINTCVAGGGGGRRVGVNGGTAPYGRVEVTAKLICQMTSSVIFESSCFLLWASIVIIRPKRQKKNLGMPLIVCE